MSSKNKKTISDEEWEITSKSIKKEKGR